MSIGRDFWNLNARKRYNLDLGVGAEQQLQFTHVGFQSKADSCRCRESEVQSNISVATIWASVKSRVKLVLDTHNESITVPPDSPDAGGNINGRVKDDGLSTQVQEA